MNLQNRLEKLEAIAGNDEDKITAIFISLIESMDGKPKQAALAGWQIENGEAVMRLEGESDESTTSACDINSYHKIWQ